jgi:hypothetical protein
MTPEEKLKAEALAWKEGKLPKGPANTDHFVTWPERAGWCLQIRFRNGKTETFSGMTEGQLNRKRMELSDKGFIGKALKP